MSLSMNTIEPDFSHTKEYQVGSGTIDLGRSYEHKMLAFISLRCLLQDFENVEIAFNAAGLGALDDVIINAQRKDGNNLKILLQLKHEEKGKNLISEQFLATKGNYSLLKYCDHIHKLKEGLDCKLKQTGIIEDLGTFSNIYFVLFTNKATSNCEFLINDGCDVISFLNTSGDDNDLYKFDLKNISGLSNLPDIDYNLYLFPNQSHVNHLEELIETEMHNVLLHYGFESQNNIRIDSKAFIEYITDWCMGKLGGHHYLTKHAILYKLTELLLSSYELDLSREKFGFSDCCEKQLWNEVVNDKRITIVDSNEETIKFLKLYVGNEIKPYCLELEKTWSCKFLKEEQCWFYKEHASLKKAMLKIVGRNGKITLLSIYKCLWFNNSIPILLKINTVGDYETILKILKLCNFKLKVIILNNFKLKPINVGVECLVTLSDLSDENKHKILNTSVKLQGRSSALLKYLVDDSLYQLIDCSAIINILMGEFNIGIALEQISDYFINRSLLKVLIKMDVLKKVGNETFVIEIKETDDKLKEFKSKTNVIICDEHNPVDIEKLKLESKPIHRVIVCHNLLDWKESSGCTTNIKKYQVSHQINFKDYLFSTKCLSHDASHLCNELDQDVLYRDNYFNKVNLVSASPGMGKSTLLDHIATIASTEMWVLNVKLIEHEDYYDKLNCGMAVDYLKHFNDSILKNRNCSDIKLAQGVFQKFVNRRQVLVLLDAIDEVSISSKNKVVEMINSIYKAGFPVWLTTRPHLTSELEDKFSTISTSLRPFSIEDQKSFLKKHFKQTADTLKVEPNQTLIDEFVEKLTQASRDNLNDVDGEFTGIPLQTKLLANAFSNQLKESLLNGVVKFDAKFDLLYLYQEFLRRKDNILRDKFGKGAKDMRLLFQNHQQLFALNLIFNIEHLFRLNINAELIDYYHNKQELIQFLQQDGVTVIQWNNNNKQQFQVNFVHRTYAEYLGACWLFNNFNSECENIKLTARLLLKQRFRKYTVYGLLFKMFDCMLTKDSQLHLSVINGRLDQALGLLKSHSEVRDKCGRTFLHIVALYGTDQKGNYIKEHTKVNYEMKRFLAHIPPHNIENITDYLGYTPLDYALHNCSFDVANKLCEKSNKLTISTNMLYLDNIFVENPRSFSSTHISLLTKMFPLLIYQRLLYLPLDHNSSIADCFKSIQRNIKANEFINDYTNKLGLITVNDLLVKMNIKSADPSQKYYYDLNFAAAYGTCLNVQDLLLSEYWRERSEQTNFYTPLYWAVKNNRLDVVKLLLYYNENVNEPCINGVTPLHCAATNGYLKMVGVLLAHGADINVEEHRANTPLTLALYNKHMEIGKILLDHNARTNIRNHQNCFPVYYAAMHGYDDLIPDLLKGVDINHKTVFHESPLQVAITNTHVSTVRLLLRLGADCNIPNRSNTFPIHNAAQEALIEILPTIVSKTVKGINVKTNGGSTALHLSINGGYYRLHGCSDECINVVNYLLNNGADPNIQDNGGNTTLHYLCDEGPLVAIEDRKRLASLLVDKGADVNLKNKNGDTPLLFLLKVLHEQDNPGYLGDILPFLIHEDNVNVQDVNGNTALHFLFEVSELYNDFRKSGARMVLNKGADVNIKNNNGDSCLHLFLRYLFHYDLIRQHYAIFPLVMDKADVNLQDSSGNSALHYCCRVYRFNKKFDVEITNTVLKKGSDLNLTNDCGETPLDLALHFKLTEIVLLLQQHQHKINNSSAIAYGT